MRAFVSLSPCSWLSYSSTACGRFFGLRSPGLAFSEILVLWTVIGVNLLLFWRVRPFAGVLLLPYELWVAFAAVLNGVIWMLSR